MSVLTDRCASSTATRNGCALPASAPPGRPSWSGILRISLVAIPIKAYPAVTSSSRGPQAHLLHADCGQRITYHKHCPRHGPVPADAIVKGYEYAPDRYVVVDSQELDRLRPARDQALLLEQCIPVAQVDASLFAGRSLHLLPDGAAAQHPYAVLAEALAAAGQGALGRVVLSSQRQLVLVRPAGQVLVLDVLHYPAQVRSPASWETALPACVSSEAERTLANQLIALSGGAVDWGRLSRYQCRRAGCFTADQDGPAATGSADGRAGGVVAAGCPQTERRAGGPGGSEPGDDDRQNAQVPYPEADGMTS